MVLTPAEFRGSMPKEYRHTISVLRGLLKHTTEELDKSKINSMLANCCQVLTVTERYYERNYNNPRQCSMVQVRKGKDALFHENQFENRILKAIAEGKDLLEVFNL